MSEDADPEQLMEQSKQQNRTNTEPTADAAGDDQDDLALNEAVADALGRLDRGELHENLTIRDENLAALFEALDQTGQLEEIQRDAESSLGRDQHKVSRAAAARVLLRVGFDQIAPDVLEDAKSGCEQYLLEQESEF